MFREKSCMITDSRQDMNKRKDRLWQKRNVVWKVDQRGRQEGAEIKKIRSREERRRGEPAVRI